VGQSIELDGSDFEVAEQRNGEGGAGDEAKEGDEEEAEVVVLRGGEEGEREEGVGCVEIGERI
jgi:hypothetical protein